MMQEEDQLDHTSRASEEDRETPVFSTEDESAVPRISIPASAPSDALEAAIAEVEAQETSPELLSPMTKEVLGIPRSPPPIPKGISANEPPVSPEVERGLASGAWASLQNVIDDLTEGVASEVAKNDTMLGKLTGAAKGATSASLGLVTEMVQPEQAKTGAMEAGKEPSLMGFSKLLAAGKQAVLSTAENYGVTGETLSQTREWAGEAVKRQVNYVGEVTTPYIDGVRGTLDHTKELVQKVVPSAGSSLSQVAVEGEYTSLLCQENATELVLPRGARHTAPYFLPSGSALCWEFMVKEYDIAFGLKQRVQELGGSTEVWLKDSERYMAGQVYRGQYKPKSEPVHVVLEWDNSFSRFRQKSVAYRAVVMKDVVPSTLSPTNAFPEAFVNPREQEIEAKPEDETAPFEQSETILSKTNDESGMKASTTEQTIEAASCTDCTVQVETESANGGSNEDGEKVCTEEDTITPSSSEDKKDEQKSETILSKTNDEKGMEASTTEQTIEAISSTDCTVQKETESANGGSNENGEKVCTEGDTITPSSSEDKKDEQAEKPSVPSINFSSSTNESTEDFLKSSMPRNSEISDQTLTPRLDIQRGAPSSPEKQTPDTQLDDSNQQKEKGPSGESTTDPKTKETVPVIKEFYQNPLDSNSDNDNNGNDEDIDGTLEMETKKSDVTEDSGSDDVWAQLAQDSTKGKKKKKKKKQSSDSDTK